MIVRNVERLPLRRAVGIVLSTVTGLAVGWWLIITALYSIFGPPGKLSGKAPFDDLRSTTQSVGEPMTQPAKEPLVIPEGERKPGLVPMPKRGEELESP